MAFYFCKTDSQLVFITHVTALENSNLHVKDLIFKNISQESKENTMFKRNEAF